MRRALATAGIGLVAIALATMGLVIPSTAQPATSDIYVVHGIPGVPVDVHVTGTGEAFPDAPALPDFQPGVVAGPIELPEGTYDIVVTGVGGDPTDAGDVVIDNTGADAVEVPGGVTATVVANVANDSETPQLSVFVEDTAPTADGQARVVVRHTANAPAVDITLPDGTPLIEALDRGEGTDGLEVPAGEITVQIRVAGTDTVVETVGPVALDAGTLYVAYATGSADPESDFGFAVVLQTIDVGQAPPVEPPAEEVPEAEQPPAPAPAPAPAQPAPAQPTFTG